MRLFRRGAPSETAPKRRKPAVSLEKNESARLDERDEYANPKAVSLLDYWHASRTQEGLPGRDAFDATHLAEWLGYISIYQYDPDRDDFRNRLEGSYVANLTRENWTGRYASEVDRRFGSRFLAELSEVRAQQTPAVDLVQIYQNDYGVAVRLLLPIGSAGGSEADQIFVALFARNYQPPSLI